MYSVRHVHDSAKEKVEFGTDRSIHERKGGREGGRKGGGPARRTETAPFQDTRANQILQHNKAALLSGLPLLDLADRVFLPTRLWLGLVYMWVKDDHAHPCLVMVDKRLRCRCGAATVPAEGGQIGALYAHLASAETSTPSKTIEQTYPRSASHHTHLG